MLTQPVADLLRIANETRGAFPTEPITVVTLVKRIT